MPGETITSEMQGAQEFEGMSEADLGKALPEQGAELPSGGTQESTGAGREAGSTEQGGQVEGGAPQATEPGSQDSAKLLQAKLDAVEQQLSQMTRENRSYRAMKSQLDRLENELKQRQSSNQTPLTPEQKALTDQRQQAEDFLNQWLEKRMEAQYGNLIQPLRQQQFFNGIQQRCTDLGFDFNELNPIFGKLIRDDMALEQQGDPAAKARIDRILTTMDPTELMLRAIAERGKALKETGERVQQEQRSAADKGGRALKAPGGAKPDATGGKLTLDKVNAMSEEERDKLSEEELLQVVPKQRR